MAFSPKVLRRVGSYMYMYCTSPSPHATHAHTVFAKKRQKRKKVTYGLMGRKHKFVVLEFSL